MDWLQITPSFMSAIASVAAAVAAIVSLMISRRSASIAESTALAVHHSSASLTYTNTSKELRNATSEFSDFCYSMWVEWARDIEGKDTSGLGGSNPRPLRHVLSNGSEMLARVALDKEYLGGSNRIILSVIRSGLGKLSDDEYQKLLGKADGVYSDFEGVLGRPSSSKSILSAPAFRWVCYQLIKRIKSEDWIAIWKDSWCTDGWLSRYQTEYLKIRPVLQSAQASLNAEREKLAHTVFPLERNKPLLEKYKRLLNMLSSLIDDCDSELLSTYKDWRYSEESSQLVLCSLATANFAMMHLDLLSKDGFEFEN